LAVVYLFSIAAAFTSALAGVMQRLGLESVPAEKAMRLGLLTHALRRGVWVAGFGLLLGTFVLQATALRFGQLSVVQPILTVDLLFVIGILSVFFHHRLSWREWAGAGAIVVGLAGFLALAHPAVGRGIPGSKAWAAVTAVVGVAAVLFAYNASLTKATTTLITQGWSHVFTHWEPYAIGVTGLVGFFLLQNALHAGPIAASRATLVMVNPLVSIVIGITIFDEHLRTGSGFAVGEVAALLVLCAGAYVLVQSPMVSGTAGSGESGELLRAPAAQRPQT
jgi:drug/metabolite transporter (DMT)-like permease